MPSFDARLRLPGQSRLPVSVVVDVSDERLRLNQGDVSLGDWPIGQIAVSPRPDGFHFDFDGEQIVLTVDDSVRFAGELAKAGRPLVAASSGRSETAGRGGLAARVGNIDPEERFADFKDRIARLEADLLTETVDPQDVFARWLALLKEINGRHGQGAMPKSLFHRLNTRLLDLLPVPARPAIPAGSAPTD